MKLDWMDFVAGDTRKNGNLAVQNISTNISFNKVELDNDAVTLGFDYVVTYTPDGSSIHLMGRARFSGKEAKKSYDEWAKEQRITGEHGEYMLNAINYGASMNAVLVAKAFNLTPPVILPKLTFTTAAPKAPGSKK